MPKENVHKPKKVIKNDEKGKHTYKDTLVRFKPLTKREQKDLLFILLDSMDLYEEGMEKAKTEEDEKRLYNRYSVYQFVVNFLVKDRDWAHYKDLLLKGARRDRLEWEKERKKEKQGMKKPTIN